jgi:hypothetical protein
LCFFPKKGGGGEITEYRPISFIHAIAKIITKMIAIHLAPLMNDIVPNAQSAFIKKRSIHGNFMYVRNLARRLHKNKIPSLLFKLDIRKAFNSIRWEYIVDILKRQGFPPKFRDWITAFLSNSSSRVLLNGVAGYPIKHGRGLRQGDPLSPLLFVIAIHLLKKILELATQNELLHKIRGRGTIVRTSLYADDAAVFVHPYKVDVQNLISIPTLFGEVTGLYMVVPIRCHVIDLDDILGGLSVIRSSFTMKYLGLPL